MRIPENIAHLSLAGSHLMETPKIEDIDFAPDFHLQASRDVRRVAAVRVPHLCSDMTLQGLDPFSAASLIRAGVVPEERFQDLGKVNNHGTPHAYLMLGSADASFAQRLASGELVGSGTRELIGAAVALEVVHGQDASVFFNDYIARLRKQSFLTSVQEDVALLLHVYLLNGRVDRAQALVGAMPSERFSGGVSQLTQIALAVGKDRSLEYTVAAANNFAAIEWALPMLWTTVSDPHVVAELKGVWLALSGGRHPHIDWSAWTDGGPTPTSEAAHRAQQDKLTETFSRVQVVPTLDALEFWQAAALTARAKRTPFTVDHALGLAEVATPEEIGHRLARVPDPTGLTGWYTAARLESADALGCVAQFIQSVPLCDVLIWLERDWVSARLRSLVAQEVSGVIGDDVGLFQAALESMPQASLRELATCLAL